MTSVVPKVVEAAGGKLGVNNGVLNISVAEKVLDGASIVTVVGEFEAGRMPKHMRVNRHPELCGNTCPGDDTPEGDFTERRFSLADEHVGGLRFCSRQSAQRPQLRGVQRVSAVDAVFLSAHVKQCILQIDLTPAQGDELADAQSMTVGHPDHRGITMPVPTELAGDGDELFNFVGSEMLSGAPVFVSRFGGRLGHDLTENNGRGLSAGST